MLLGVTSTTQDIIDNHYGVASVIADIAPGNFQFKTQGCGVWTLGGGVGAPLTPQNTASTSPSATACPNSNVCILSPVNGTSVKKGAIVVFTGTANSPNFARYQFQAGNGQSWGDIADFRKKPVVNGELMELYTDTLPPGIYTIRLQVIDNTGNAGAEKAQVIYCPYKNDLQTHHQRRSNAPLFWFSILLQATSDFLESSLNLPSGSVGKPCQLKHYRRTRP